MQATSATRREYTARVNRVIDFVELNYGKELSVESLATIANFSKFHFHRVFKAVTGETLSGFVQRIRLERAATMLTTTEAPITAVALDCGFSSPATFARSFKAMFSMSASAWREDDSKNRKVLRKQRNANATEREAIAVVAIYGESLAPSWNLSMPTPTKPLETTVSIVERPNLYVAYARSVGAYAGDSELFRRLFGSLMSWTGARRLLGPDTEFILIAHDDPKVTEEAKQRISVCATVPEGTEPGGEIGTMHVPGGTCAIGRFETADQDVGLAWEAMMAGWLPESGFQLDDRHCYQISRNRPDEHPQGKLIFDLCLPVKPL